jgi:pSer/pThr/pTyr-binding forkhead associated (FHA) protein
MNFCKMCGSTLRAGPGSSLPGASKAALPSPLAAVVGNTPAPKTPAAPHRICPSCSRATPSAFAFCQHCGLKVGAVVAGEIAIADTLTSDDEVVPLVKKRAEAREPSSVLGAVEITADAPDDIPADATAVAYGRLVAVLPDGSDGAVHSLIDELVDIGRSEGQLKFPDDAFLAARHARLERRAGAIVLLPLDTINGVYVRVRPGEIVPLRHGDFVLCGKEVFRFEVLEPEERAQLAAIQHGVRLFGSPMRAPWGRLLQMVQLGIARDVYHLGPPEVTLGREEGDLRFPDDEFMSRRHARITSHDAKFELTDEGSSNGTYIRLRGERVLHPGDRLRLGDQLFRFEPE